MTKRTNNAVGPQVRSRAGKKSKLIPVLAVMTLIVGLAGATQFFAHGFQYQASLGPNINHIYQPWSILGWASKWYSTYPDAFMRASSVGTIIAAFGLGSLIIAKMVRASSAKANEFLHGSARWADKRDIQAAGLLPKPPTIVEKVSGNAAHPSDGVYVGAWMDEHGRQHYLRHAGPEHVL